MNNDLFSPGLHKLIHHQAHLAKIENGEIVGPIHVSVWPINKCQLNCPYCCFGDVDRDDVELSLDDFKNAVDVLTKYGLKALEESGGGDPLLWSHFNEATDYAKNKGLNLSCVTNGLALDAIPQKILAKFDWIRISIQSVNYAKQIKFDYIPDNVRKSMSYIVNDQNRLNHIEKLYEYAKENNIIIRVAPIRPCEPSWEEKVENEVKRYGYPLLFFKKAFGTPPGCFMLWLRAAITWKGEFLPCPSIELSPESAGKIPDNFAVCHVRDLENWLNLNPPRDMGYRCKFCNCGFDENTYIFNLLKPIGDVNFV
jgi:MoaA/NifB/PqqE/SkfB family radical SAM enzyme